MVMGAHAGGMVLTPYTPAISLVPGMGLAACVDCFKGPLPSDTAPVHNGIVHRPFAEVLRSDLASGLLNRVVGVSEPLTSFKNTEVGDPHCYFRISDVVIYRDAVDFTLTYIRRGDDGLGYEMAKRLSRSHDGKPYDSIDEAAMLMVLQSAMDGDLYRDATRMVYLSGRRIYPAFYKCGPTYGAEARGRTVLKLFDINVPPIFPSPSKNSFWSTGVPGVALSDLSDLCERSSKGLQTFLDEQRDVGLMWTKDLGRMSAAMYLIGNDDFHVGQILFDARGANNYAIDLEGTGIPNFSDLPVFTGDMDDVAAILNSYFEYSFSTLIWGRPVQLEGDYLESIGSGVHEVFRRCIDDAERIDRAVDEIDGDFWARVMLTGTNEYALRGFNDAIPHYSVLMSSGLFKRLVRSRMDTIRRHYASHRQVWQSDVKIGFEPHPT